MQNEIKVDLKDIGLFGNDAAEQETDTVFNSYAVERPELSSFLNAEIPIQIARAYKGQGKSALLRMVKDRVNSNCLVIDTTGVSLSPVIESLDSDYWTREWKSKILKLIATEIGSKIGFAYTEDAMQLVEEAERNSFKNKSIISVLSSRFSTGKIGIKEANPVTEYDRLLERYTNYGENIWLIIDDIDQNFKNTELNKIKVASYFTAIRQIITLLPEIRIRTSIRPNVWSILKRDYEAMSHIEQYMIDIEWQEEDIKNLLAKRIEGYLKRTGQLSQFYLTNPFDKTEKLISLVFENPMPWGLNQRMRPASVVLATLSRHRPRWLIELCKESVKDIGNNTNKIILFSNINNQLESFGKRRIEDTIAEYKSQCEQIEDLLVAFADQDERYTTDQLLKLIKQKITNHLNIKIAGNIGKANEREIASFLYQIAFLTARRDFEDGKYEHIPYEKAPHFLKSNTNIDQGVSWEIHPVFRQALNLKNVETKQARIARQKRQTRK